METTIKPFTIGLVQDVAGADSDANVERAVLRIRSAAAKGAQVICLQEIFNAPYFCKKQEAARFDLALTIPGPLTSTMSALARELSVVLVVPIFERQGPGVYRNSAIVIDADGEMLGIYRKMHIPDDPLYFEKYYFAPGDADAPVRTNKLNGHSGFKVWNTKYGRIGVLICWDQWYPEAARITALLGADVIFYPTAIGWHPAEKDSWGAAQRDAWRTAQRAHAIANGVHVAAANRVGFEGEENTDGIEFFGSSFISDPFGRVIAEAGGDPDILVATVDPALNEEVRRNWPFLRDRRIDAYGPILNRYIG